MSPPLRSRSGAMENAMTAETDTQAPKPPALPTPTLADRFAQVRVAAAKHARTAGEHIRKMELDRKLAAAGRATANGARVAAEQVRKMELEKKVDGLRDRMRGLSGEPGPHRLATYLSHVSDRELAVLGLERETLWGEMESRFRAHDARLVQNAEAEDAQAEPARSEAA